MDHLARRNRLLDRLRVVEVDLFLVTKRPNVRYLTGFTGSNAQLVLGPNEAVLLTDPRYEGQAAREAPGVRLSVYSGDMTARVTEVLEASGGRRIGFEAAGITYHAHARLAQAGAAPGLTFVPTVGEIERLRWSKEPAELALIERAQEITDGSLGGLIDKLVEGVTEREAGWELEQMMREAGADAVAFDSIVAFGENAAEPHHRPADRSLRFGDIVKLDFGCTVGGYSSDMTRTIAFGEPGEELRRVHDLVAQAQAAGIEAIREGVSGGEVDEASRSVVRHAGYGERFGHSLGHGIGLEVHEGPTLRHRSDDLLPEGAVVTVEPGVYLPGLGGVRIEDMVVVGRDSARPLPSSTRELVVL